MQTVLLEWLALKIFYCFYKEFYADLNIPLHEYGHTRKIRIIYFC